MGQNKSSDVVWHHATVTRERHNALNGHSSVIVVHRPFRVPGNPSCGRFTDVISATARFIRANVDGKLT